MDGIANHTRRHNDGLKGWQDATAAVTTVPVILGDKENVAATAHFNVGHVVDMAEPGGGAGGCDRLLEMKAISPLRAKHEAGRGSATNGGTPANVGHLFGFGNTEERLRWENYGCAGRGHPSQGFFDHSTGRGWVKKHKGCYHDGVYIKKNELDLVVHETIGGGFSPPAVSRMCRLARAAREGTDRTRYTSRGKISYKAHHTQRVSLAIVKADSHGILKSYRSKSASLSRM